MSRYVFELRADSRVVVFTDLLKCECPICGEAKSLGAFGLRHMGNGQVRMQPECRACRGLTPRQRRQLRAMIHSTAFFMGAI